MVPINIAVTGHRDISINDTELYKSIIIKIIKDYKNKYPNSEIQILSGMAEGADILAAEAALELGIKLVAVLPMSKENYINTFSNKETSTPVFEKVLSKAYKVIDLSKIYKSCYEDNQSYVQLGVYLTEHAQSIIALWNGIDNNNAGGTSTVVKYALEGMPKKFRDKYCIVDRYDTIPVHHIPVKRQKVKLGNEPDYISTQNNCYKTYYPSIWKNNDKKAMICYYENQLKEIDEFNKASNNLNIDNAYLNGSDDKELNTSNGIEKIIATQKTADTLASKLQKKTVRLLITQLLFGFFVFFWVSLADEVVPFAPQILLLSPLFFILCVLIFRHVNKKSIEERYYLYRALAECLRVQFYWKSASIEDNAHRSYSKKNAFELGWVIQACKNVSIDINYELNSIDLTSANLNKIKRYWFDDQDLYFSLKQKENNEIIKRNKKWTFFLFGAGLVFVILLILERLILNTYINSELLMHLLLFLIDASLAGGAIFSGYLDKRQFESEQKQYSRMSVIFNQAKKELEAVPMSNIQDSKDIIVELGCDALAENADWVVYNRMSNIDIPMG